MKVKTHADGIQITPENAFDRALLEFPELTFEIRSEATRALHRTTVGMTIRHNSTKIYRGGMQFAGFFDEDVGHDSAVQTMTNQLLQRAAPDLAAWRTANPVPKPKDIPSDPITSSPGADTASS